FELLRRDPLPAGTRVLDLGCGQGILLALLACANEKLELRGVELHAAEVTRAGIALGPDGTIEQADLRCVSLARESADRIALLDVIHYLEPEAQDALLARCAAALAPRGVLWLRVCDASAGWRARLTRFTDRLGTLGKGGGMPALHLRGEADWRRALESLG